MREPSRFEIWYGRDEPAVETREVTAGPLVAQLEGIDLRYVGVGGVEVVRRLFVAVRDAAWGTIAPAIDDLTIDTGGRSFRVGFEASHVAGELRFRWRGELAGEADGTLDCRLDGAAASDFQYNRIGFCVLHPRENAGRPYRARTPEGEISGTLPDAIGVQRFEDGKLWPLFPSYDRLEIEVADGFWARFEFEGDLFEMEDQRNWTDASFKTYSTPLTLGWPHQAKAGQRIAQRVRLTTGSGAAPRRRRARAAVEVTLGEPFRLRLPRIGLGLASHGGTLSKREGELLRALAADHVRADLRLSGDWQAELARAAETAAALGSSLELAVFLAADPAAELTALAAALSSTRADVERFLVFREGEIVTESRWVRLARERLPQGAFAGGTDGWFVDLNRGRPDLEGLDAVAYSVNATVHADDDTSLRETPAAQGDTVRSAHAFCADLPIVVSPVTIRPRAWPFGDTGEGALPFQVDRRQCSLLGAGWTVASAKHLAEAGATSVTYFETTGWRGVIETEEGPPLPELFPSRPGAAFPAYHVLADLGEWKGSELVEARSSDPLAVEALAVRAGGSVHLLLANLTPSAQRCAVALPRGASIRPLDESTAVLAADRPEEFRAERRPLPGALELAPYSVLRIDA